MSSVFRWKVLLPLFQLALVIPLWLYIPLQYRKEVLEMEQLPTDHPFRYRFEGPRRFPPLCERILLVFNFPAYSVSEGIVGPVEYHIEYSRQAGFREWVFTLPVNDPELRPPKRIYYFVGVGEWALLALIALQWFWVGWRLDAYDRRATSRDRPSRPVARWAGIAADAALVLYLIGFCGWKIFEWKTSPAPLPQQLHVALFGLIWPALLFTCLCFAVRGAVPPRAGDTT